MYSVVLMMAMTGAPESPDFFFRKHRCDGGSGCCGCTGGCYGGCSGYACGGGCGGCRGGCYGGGCRGGCYGGGCYGAGCCGTVVVNYGCCGCMGTMAAPAATPTPPAQGGKPAGTGMFYATPATLVVSLPADATLKVDGTATKATDAVRTFSTPALTPGQSYFYTLTAEVVRDGKTMTATQQVTVRAGETSRIELPASAFSAAVAMK